MDILIITDYLPYPLIAGDRLRVYNLIKNISAIHKITLLSLIRKDDPLEAIDHLKSYCQNIYVAELKRTSKVKHIPGLVCFGLLGIPLELHYLYSKKMIAKIKEITKSKQFDIIQYEHSRMAFYDKYVDSQQRAKRIIMFHNVIFEQTKRGIKIDIFQANKKGYPMNFG